MGENLNKNGGLLSDEKGKLRLKIEGEEKRSHKFGSESQGKILENRHSGQEHRNFFIILISSI